MKVPDSSCKTFFYLYTTYDVLFFPSAERIVDELGLVNSQNRGNTTYDVLFFPSAERIVDELGLVNSQNRGNLRKNMANVQRIFHSHFCSRVGSTVALEGVC